MNWKELKAGDIVVPTDIHSNMWLVLHVEDSEEGGRKMLYASLGTGAVHETTTGTEGFSPSVKVLRDGEDVNK